MAFDIVGGSDDDAAGAYDAVSGDTGGGSDRQKVDAKKLPVHMGGAGPLDIAAGAPATFTFNLNMQVRPDHLCIPDAVAPSVVVSAYQIGAVSVNASADPVPGDMFRRDSTIKLRPAVSGTPSVPVKITLINLTGAPITKVYLGIAGPSKRVN